MKGLLGSCNDSSSGAVTGVCEVLYNNSSLYTCDVCTLLGVYYIFERHKMQAQSQVLSPTARDVWAIP